MRARSRSGSTPTTRGSPGTGWVGADSRTSHIRVRASVHVAIAVQLALHSRDVVGRVDSRWSREKKPVGPRLVGLVARARDARLAGFLREGAAAARADELALDTAVRPDDERLEIGLVAAMRPDPVHPRRLGVEARHGSLAADSAGAGHVGPR